MNWNQKTSVTMTRRIWLVFTLLLTVLMVGRAYAVDELGLYQFDGDVINDTVPDDGSITRLLPPAVFDIYNGRIDLSGNGTIGPEDNGTLNGHDIIDGLVDTSNDGSITRDDDGTITNGALGSYNVFNGFVDVSGDGQAPTPVAGDDAIDFLLGSSNPQLFKYFFSTDDTTTVNQGPADGGNNDITIFQGGASKDHLPITEHINIAIIDGLLDYNDNGSVTTDDDGRLELIDIINGFADVNNDGIINASDNGEYHGTAIIAGRFDVNGNGNIFGADPDDDGSTIKWSGGWEWSSNNIQTKNDIYNAWGGTFLYPGPANGPHLANDFILVFGADVVPSSGAAAISFWFVQDPKVDFIDTVAGGSGNDFQWKGSHTIGDLLLQTNIAATGQSDLNSSALALVWNPGNALCFNGTAPLCPSNSSINGSGNYDNLTTIRTGSNCEYISGSPQLLCSMANQTDQPLPPAWPYDHDNPTQNTETTHLRGHMVEGGINLSALYRDLDIAVPCFSKAIAETRTTDSVTGTLTDFSLSGFEACAFEIEKTGDDTAVIGDLVTFTITLRNTGLLPLTFSSIHDPVIDGQAGAGTTQRALLAAGCGTIEAQQECSFQVTYLAELGTPDPLINAVTATFTGPDGTPFTDDDHHLVDLVYAGSIGDQVWLDENGNGVFDAGEDGLPGVAVTLTPTLNVVAGQGIDTNGDGLANEADNDIINGTRVIAGLLDINNDGVVDVNDDGTFQGFTVTDGLVSGTTTVTGDIQTTITDANGEYVFSQLPAGDYEVSITPPTGLNATFDANGGLDNTTSLTLAEGETNITTDFGLNWVPPADTNTPGSGATGAIGDRVWNDADGDGVQDAGETGMANVGVVLTYDSNGDGLLDAVYAATVTDATGNYIFDDLPVGLYGVVLIGDVTSLASLPDQGAAIPTAAGPAGFDQTFDPDEGVPCTVCDASTTNPILLAPGDVYLNADFGFQDAAGGVAVRDVSGTVFLDADVDGNNDTGGGPDAGFGGVTVSLGLEVLIVDGLIDLDHSAGTDNGILDGVQVIAGKLDLNGDGVISAADAGTFNGVPVIAGLVDLDRDGVTGGDTGDLGTLTVIAASTTTDASGDYLFPGVVPGYYSVIVTDNDVILKDTYQTADPDEPGVCVGCDERTSIVVTTANVADIDFGYAPTSHEAGEGLISGAVGIDITDNNLIDPGEELTGVEVELYQLFDVISGRVDLDNDGVTNSPSTDDNGVLDGYRIIDGQVDFNNDGMINSSDTGSFSGCGCVFEGLSVSNGNLTTDPTLRLLIGTKTTDAIGSYVFGGIDPDGQYSVETVAATLPPGSSNDFDASGSPTDGVYYVDLSAVPSGVQHGVDFLVAGNNSIGGTIWNDANADGTLTDGTGGTVNETGAGIANVTVALIDANGDILATTNSSGDYFFDNLPDGTYSVKVLDDNRVLTGYWLSDGPNDGADNNSQVDPYVVSVSNGQTDTTADFGYYIDDALLGNTVFNDINGDGIQDAGEPGIAGVPVSLTVTWPTGDSVLVTVFTDSNGEYSFANLFLDEDFHATGAGQPSFQVSVNTGAGSPVDGYLSTHERPNATSDATEIAGAGVDGDADDPAGTGAFPERTFSDVTNDFGFVLPSSISGTAWVDTNGDGIFNGVETILPGITVNLLDAAGNPVLDEFGAPITTVTDASGNYTFVGLYPGNYTIEFATATGYQRTLQDQGGDDTLDSDADPTNGRVTGIVLTPGTNVSDVDAGYVPLGSLSGYVLADTGASPGSIDQTGGAADDAGISGVVVELWTDDGSNGGTAGDGIPDLLYASTTTGLDGSYDFTGVPIGDYVIVERATAGFQSVLDADTTADGDNVANTDSTDDRIPVTVEFNTEDDGNIFLETINSTVAVADDNNTIEGFPVSGNVLTNDWDPQNQDDNPGNDQTISLQSFQVDTDGDGILDSGSLGSAISVSGVDELGNLVANAGSLILNADGSYTFVPEDGFTGEVNVQYTICDDGSPAACDTTTLRISVNPLLDPFEPTSNSVEANNDENISYGEAVSSNLLDNDRDAEGDSYSVTALSFPTGVNGSGEITYSAGSIGSTTTVYGLDSNGQAVVAGTLTIASDGSYTYVPCTDTTTPVAECEGEFKGTLQVDYTITDNNGAPSSDTASLTIQVLAEPDEQISGLANPPEVNDPPVAGDDLSLTMVNVAVGGNWLANDSDPNDAAGVSAADDDITLHIYDFGGTPSPTPSSGAIDPDVAPGSPVSIGTATTQQGGSIEYFSDGTYLYTPPLDYAGPDQISYQICDVTTVEPQPLCDFATIYLVVLPEMDFGDLQNDGNALPPSASAVAQLAKFKTKGSGSGRHFIFPGLRLGATVDGEPDGQPSDLAIDDGADEDSTSFEGIQPDDTNVYRLGVEVTNNRDRDAIVTGWMDLNCDEDFDDAGERATGRATTATEDAGGNSLQNASYSQTGTLETGWAGVADQDARGQVVAGNSGTQIVGLEWYAGGSALISQADADNKCSFIDGAPRMFARIRVTSDRGKANGGSNRADSDFFSASSPTPNGPSRDGEIEDYQLSLAASTTPVMIAEVNATAAAGGGAEIAWLTASEQGAAAFRVERWVQTSAKGGHWTRAHQAPWIPALLAMQGGQYQVYDANARAGETYTYQIVEQASKGKQIEYGPYELTIEHGDAPLNTDGAGFARQENVDLNRVIALSDHRAAAQGSSTPGKGYKSSRTSLQLAGPAQGSGDARLAAPPGAAASARTLRLEIGKTGIYRIAAADLATYLDLTAAKLKDQLKAGQFYLTTGGTDVSWFADSANNLYFYGESIDSHYSATRSYWLAAKGKGPQMGTVKVKGAAAVNAVFIDEADFEENTFAFLTSTDNPEDDYWFWNYLYAFDGYRTLTYPVALPDTREAAGSISLRLFGNANTTHQLRVKVNGVEVDGGPVIFSGAVAFETTVNVPAAAFAGGGDTANVELTLDNSPTGALSSVFLDGFKITYTRGYRAYQDGITYQTADATQVSGFSTGSIVTLDVTDAQQPKLVTGGDVVQAGSTWSYRAKLPLGEYASAGPAGLLSPVSVTVDTASDLKSRNNEADYVVIASDELWAGAQTLADYRSVDLQTMMVNIQDIYDEFSYGLPDPAAVRQFVAASREWKTVPRYVAIVGDGSFDYQDRLGLGYNIINPVLFGNAQGLHASDTLLGDPYFTGTPIVAVGRIPAKTVAEVQNYVLKLDAYENGNTLLKPGLLLTDKPDNGGNFKFSGKLIANETAGEQVVIDLEGSTRAAVRSAVFDRLQQGASLMNYVGHGGVDRISKQSLLVNSDADTGINNNAHTPPFVGLSCLINNYSVAGWDSLGERLVLRPDAGMIASWAASGESYNLEATQMGIRFNGIYPQHDRLGDAIIEALSGEALLKEVYTLLGDPALRIR